MAIEIRKIRQQDNAAVAQVIRDVLIEHNVPKVGTAYADPELDTMFEAYTRPRTVYFVLEKEGRIIGGAGVAPLQNGDEDVCELQKMYFLDEARGLGYGTLMMQKCLAEAKDLGFKNCYLETMPYMEMAQKLYLKSGFSYIGEPMGSTGHTSCPVWMLKDLDTNYDG
ncbi:MAG TPA: GNAT family N-acetyltransferase [Flavobacterium sp.]|jgi:putative acetyltransferase